MNLLIITNWLPFPPTSGNPLRVFNLIKRIAQKHSVNLLSFIRETDSQDSIQTLKQYCSNIYTIPIFEKTTPKEPFVNQISNKAMELFFPWRAYLSRQMIQKLQEITASGSIDILQIEDSFMGGYLNYLNHSSKTKSALTFHDIDHQKYERLSKITSNFKQKIKFWLRSQAMRYWEPHIAAHFDLNIFTSTLDEKIIRRRNPQINSIVLPNGVDTKQLQPLPLEAAEKSLLFVGNMSYLPNEDGVLFFYKEIYPLIAKHLPDLHLYVVGINPSKRIKALENETVHVTGAVADLLPYYQRCSACIVPLRAGGGTRLKILEAMAYGRPVISTTLGAEGLIVEDEKHILIADTPQLFAEKVINVLTNPDQQRRIIRNARELVELVYDWDVIAQQALMAYDKL